MVSLTHGCRLVVLLCYAKDCGGGRRRHRRWNGEEGFRTGARQGDGQDKCATPHASPAGKGIQHLASNPGIWALACHRLVRPASMPCMRQLMRSHRVEYSCQDLTRAGLHLAGDRFIGHPGSRWRHLYNQSAQAWGCRRWPLASRVSTTSSSLCSNIRAYQ